MKIKYSLNVALWLDGIEVEGRGKDDVLRNFAKMSIQDLIEEGYIKNYSVTDVDETILERSYEIKVYNIDYDIDEYDLKDDQTVEDVLNSLPLTLAITLTDVAEKYDLFDLIQEEVEYQTGVSPKNFDYQIIKEY